MSTSRVAHLVGQALEVYSGAVWRDGDTIAARSWRLGDICLVEARTLMLFADGESVLVSSGMVVPVPH